MKITNKTVEAMRIEQSAGLDPIDVYWENFAPGKGMVTITIFGSSWSAYFGAMGDKTIQQFFSFADAGYMVDALMWGARQLGKQPAKVEKYLIRIVAATKEAMEAMESMEELEAAKR